MDARSIETLRGSVQDLLLSREVSTDTVEVEQRAALALTRMTLAGVLSRTAADEIWRAICATGPRDALMSAESGVLTASRS